MRIFILVLTIFALGSCVEMVKGIFKGSHWVVISTNTDNTYDVQDGEWILRGVRSSYLEQC